MRFKARELMLPGFVFQARCGEHMVALTLALALALSWDTVEGNSLKVLDFSTRVAGGEDCLRVPAVCRALAVPFLESWIDRGAYGWV